MGIHNDVLRIHARNHVLIDSMLRSMEKFKFEDELVVLNQINDLLHNILLLGNSQNDQVIIKDLIKNKMLLFIDDKVKSIPISYNEQEKYLLSEISYQLDNLSRNTDQEVVQGELNNTIQFAETIISAKRFLSQALEIFLDYLFSPEDNVVSNRQKLKLFLILSEEYNYVLKDRDITSPVVLGHKTIMMIVNRVYQRIDDEINLKEISKDKLIILIKKFFFVIEKTVNSYLPV